MTANKVKIVWEFCASGTAATAWRDRGHPYKATVAAFVSVADACDMNGVRAAVEAALLRETTDEGVAS